MLSKCPSVDIYAPRLSSLVSDACFVFRFPSCHLHTWQVTVGWQVSHLIMLCLWLSVASCVASVPLTLSCRWERHLWIQLTFEPLFPFRVPGTIPSSDKSVNLQPAPHIIPGGRKQRAAWEYHMMGRQKDTFVKWANLHESTNVIGAFIMCEALS